MRLKFCICTITIGMVITRSTWFQDKGLNASDLNVTKCAVIEVAIKSIEENYLIVYILVPAQYVHFFMCALILRHHRTVPQISQPIFEWFKKLNIILPPEKYAHIYDTAFFLPPNLGRKGNRPSMEAAQGGAEPPTRTQGGTAEVRWVQNVRLCTEEPSCRCLWRPLPLHNKKYVHRVRHE